MFSCEYCEIFKNNTFLEQVPWLLVHIIETSAEALSIAQEMILRN